MKGAYHIKTNRFLSKGNTYTNGYRLKTKGPGRFPVRLCVIHDHGDGNSENKLTLIVE